MRKLFVLGALFLACLPLEEENDIPYEQGNIYHGTLSLQAGDYQALSFSPEAGDSILGGAKSTSGGGFDFFWADEANFGKWLSGDSSAVLYDHSTGVTSVDVAGEIPSTDHYRAVFYASGGAVELSVRLKTRRMKQ